MGAPRPPRSRPEAARVQTPGRPSRPRPDGLQGVGQLTRGLKGANIPDGLCFQIQT